MTRRCIMWAMATGMLVSACSSSAIQISDAWVSRDDLRLQLTLDSCNAELAVDLEQSQDQIVVTVSDEAAPIVDLGGNDCQDLFILELEQPLDGRTVIDGSTEVRVHVRGPYSEQATPPPYDTARVTESQYLDALGAMVACLTESDPDLEAWVYQDLDWKTYRWHKEPDEEGYLERPEALDFCHERHLRALEPPSDGRWSNQDLSEAALTWVNQLGLDQDDLNVWSDRLTEICDTVDTAGTAGLTNLAVRYIEEDAEVSVRGDGDRPPSQEAAAILSQIKASLCESSN